MAASAFPVQQKAILRVLRSNDSEPLIPFHSISASFTTQKVDTVLRLCSFCVVVNCLICRISSHWAFSLRTYCLRSPTCHHRDCDSRLSKESNNWFKHHPKALLVWKTGRYDITMSKAASAERYRHGSGISYEAPVAHLRAISDISADYHPDAYWAPLVAFIWI